MAELYGIVVSALLFVGLCMLAGDGCDARNIHTKQCERSCDGRGEVFSRESGVCTCRDGSTWLWQEGYTRRLGKAVK